MVNLNPAQNRISEILVLTFSHRKAFIVDLNIAPRFLYVNNKETLRHMHLHNKDSQFEK